MFTIDHCQSLISKLNRINLENVEAERAAKIFQIRQYPCEASLHVPSLVEVFKEKLKVLCKSLEEMCTYFDYNPLKDRCRHLVYLINYFVANVSDIDVGIERMNQVIAIAKKNFSPQRFPR